MCTQGLTLDWVWDVLVLTRLEERGRHSTLGSLIKGLQERAGYQGKNNTHTTQSSRHQRARKREVEIESGFWNCVFLCTSFVWLHKSMSLTQRGIEHYCNSSERSIKPSVRETTLSSKPLCKDSAWQKSLPSENTVYFLSVSVYVFVSQHVCVFGRWKSGEDEYTQEIKVQMSWRGQRSCWVSPVEQQT